MKKEFTKADLKDGMIVEYANEKRKLVIGDGLYSIHGWLPIKEYGEDLTMGKPWNDLTIKKVYKIKKDCQGSLYDIFETENLILIWEREIIKEDQLRVYYDVYLSEKTEWEKSDKHIALDHKPSEKELQELIIKHKARMVWYCKRYCYNPCDGCFGAANNDCQHCGFGGGQDE